MAMHRCQADIDIESNNRENTAFIPRLMNLLGIDIDMLSMSRENTAYFPKLMNLLDIDIDMLSIGQWSVVKKTSCKTRIISRGRRSLFLDDILSALDLENNRG
jgi:hypothetical protein